MDSPFLNTVAGGCCAGHEHARGALRVSLHARAARTEAAAALPTASPFSEQPWEGGVAHLNGGERLVVGGKSLGGRIASMVADRAGVRGLVCLGYPFHPPGKPERLRTQHLENLRTPALVVQGTRDMFGSREDVAGYRLSEAIRIAWIEDGDHSFKPRASSGRTESQNLAEAIARVREFPIRL